MTEAEQHAKWDAVLDDIESRYEQLRATPQVRLWPLMLAGLVVGAGLFAAGAMFCKLLQ